MPNLGLPASIAWWGVGGLTWAGLRRSVESQVLLCSPPKIIILHLGGNDIGQLPCEAIANQIAKEIRYLRSAFADCTIIWVNILDRIKWRPTDFPRKAINSIRRRLNRQGRSWVKAHKKSDVLNIDIDTSVPGFYAPDGVHLSAVGLEFYLNALRDILCKHIQ